jgi:O-antigen ligase
MFIFGNPNDYILNCILIFCILFFIDKKFINNLFQIVCCLVVLFILSIFAKARIGELIILILFILVLFKNFRNLNFINKYKYYIILFITCIILLLGKSIFVKEDSTSEFNLFSYFENIFKNNTIKETKKSKIKEFGKPSKIQKDSLVSVIQINDYPINKGGISLFVKKGDSSDLITGKFSINEINDGSLKIRIKLIKNGIYLIKTHPIFGVGPGQFQELNKLKKVPNDTGTNFSPHNYFIELISNYAILAIVFFIFLFFLLIRLFIYRIQNRYWLIVTFFIFFLASVVPSAFTYQPINWFFMSLWMLYSQVAINDNTCQIRNL